MSTAKTKGGDRANLYLLLGWGGFYLRVYRFKRETGKYLRERGGWQYNDGRSHPHASCRHSYVYSPFYHYRDHITETECDQLTRLEASTLLASGLFEVADSCKEGGYGIAWATLTAEEVGAQEGAIYSAKSKRGGTVAENQTQEPSE